MKIPRAIWRTEPVLLAVGAPILGLALAVSDNLFRAFAPEALANNVILRILLFLIGAAGYLIAIGTQVNYFNIVVFFGGFFLLAFGIGAIESAVEKQVLHDRGEVITCTVDRVDKRTEVSTDSEGHTHVTTHFNYQLACPVPGIREMTTKRPVAAVDEQLDVAYDPEQRLSPRPAKDVENPSWLSGFLMLGAAIALRLLYVLDSRLFRLRSGALWLEHVRRLLRQPKSRPNS